MLKALPLTCPAPSRPSPRRLAVSLARDGEGTGRSRLAGEARRCVQSTVRTARVALRQLAINGTSRSVLRQRKIRLRSSLFELLVSGRPQVVLAMTFAARGSTPAILKADSTPLPVLVAKAG